MALSYEYKLKFKIVFAFVVLHSIAWLNHPRGSNFYLRNLFFEEELPLRTQEQKNESQIHTKI